MKVVNTFRNGGSQAIRIPKAWAFETKQVLVTPREDGSLLVEPHSPDLDEWWERLEPVEDFMAEGRSQPEAPPERESLL